MKITQEIIDNKEYITGLRHYFHQHPEVSGKEYKTCARIIKELTDMGLSPVKVGETGVAAVITGEAKVLDTKAISSAPHIILRADIDALRIQEKNTCEYHSINPGVMHACGHDAHAAALLGAAKVLQNSRDTFAGKVTVIFQQAEEVGAGAKVFLQNGYLNDVDRVFGIHMASYLPTGTISVKKGECNASCDYFKITVKGKSAHVSRPDLGIDALYIASQIVVSIQAVVARMIHPLAPALVGIGKMQAGTNYNIIANEAVLEGTTRAFNEETRTRVNEAVTRIAKQTAEQFNAEAEVTFVDYASPLVNDDDVNAEVANVASQIVGSDHVITDMERSMMADDFAEYLKVVKGQYAFVGSGNGSSTSYPHHHERFDVDEDAVLIAASLHVEYVRSLSN